jgi:hypothetical protein
MQDDPFDDMLLLIRKIVRLNPDALHCRDGVTMLYPFQHAATRTTVSHAKVAKLSLLLTRLCWMDRKDYGSFSYMVWAKLFRFYTKDGVLRDIPLGFMVRKRTRLIFENGGTRISILTMSQLSSIAPVVNYVLVLICAGLFNSPMF